LGAVIEFDTALEKWDRILIGSALPACLSSDQVRQSADAQPLLVGLACSEMAEDVVGRSAPYALGRARRDRDP
jgi:hypothetical protein